MILLVDDDRRYVKTYIEELKYFGYEVIHQDNVDKAMDFILDRLKSIDLLILDVMMPYGKIFENQDTDNGLRTGLFFLEKIKEVSIDHIFPIVIFTNVSTNNLPIEIRELVLQKEEYTPYNLVEKVRQILISKH